MSRKFSVLLSITKSFITEYAYWPYKQTYNKYHTKIVENAEKTLDTRKKHNESNYKLWHLFQCLIFINQVHICMYVCLIPFSVIRHH